MEDEPATRLDHPERLCDALLGILDDLEDSDVIGEERASELRSEIYRSIDIPED